MYIWHYTHYSEVLRPPMVEPKVVLNSEMVLIRKQYGTGG